MHRYDPHPHAVDEAEVLDRVAGLDQAGRPPFAPGAVDMLEALSRRLLASPRVPQVTALGFWLRRAAVLALENRFAAGLPAECVAAPRGVALHLPPANVDTLFVYSWALSVLAGNANVVRLPSRPGAEALALLADISVVLDRAGEAGRHLFVSYPWQGGTTAALSRLADARLIWGGDAKVDAVSALPLRPGGISLGFPDRFSYAAVAAPAYDDLDEGGRDALADRFFTDVFLFDQRGCASPQVLYWVGEGGGPGDFLERVNGAVRRRGYTVEPGTALAKFGHAARLAAEGRIRAARPLSNELMVLEAGPGLDLRGDTMGGGVVAAIAVPNLEAVAAQVSRRDQTLTHFGFTPEEVRAFALRAGPKGLSRMVPVGQALSFDAVWDGVDLLRALSRLVVVR